MEYEENYSNRLTAKKHKTRIYSPDELNEISILIHEYFKIENPNKKINTNEAYYVGLADEINDTLYARTKVIKPKYLCEIATGKSYSSKKIIDRIDNITAFLQTWLQTKAKQRKDTLIVEKGVISDWHAKTNNSTPQWADYVALPLENKILKQLTCVISSSSKYYRFGFKFLRLDGRLFGDGSLQSQDNNFIFHVGKNYTENDIFLTVYKNGIRERPDKYPKIIPTDNSYIFELNIDSENIIHFLINTQEVYKYLISKEILRRVYMLAWGDGNTFEVKVSSIKMEMQHA